MRDAKIEKIPEPEKWAEGWIPCSAELDDIVSTYQSSKDMVESAEAVVRVFLETEATIPLALHYQITELGKQLGMIDTVRGYVANVI